MTIIYAFTYKPEYEGLLKVGETVRSVNERLKSNILMPSEPEIELSIECDGISDHDVHKELKRMGKKCVRGEWFKCTKEDVIQAILNAKGIQVQDEGACKNEELIKFIDENQRNIEKLEGATNLSEVANILAYCKKLGIVNVKDLKDAVDLWHKIESNQSSRAIEAISSYGVEKLLRYYETTFNKIEKVSNFNIEKIIKNKNIINSFLKLHNVYGEETLPILEKVNILDELLKEHSISPIFTKPLLKNFKNICEEAAKMGISEKECIKLMQETVESATKMMKELNCYNFEGLRSRLNKYEEYMTNKESIDRDVSKIQKLWEQWEVKNIHEFWDVAKRVEKEQKNCKKNFVKAIVGEENDPAIIEDLEERVFEYGKYRGKKIKQIIYEDSQYIKWLTDNYIENIQVMSILLEQVQKEKREKRREEKEKKQLSKKSLEDIRNALKAVKMGEF